MTIDKILVAGTRNAVSALYNTELSEDQVNLQETRKEFEGQLTIVTFPFTRFSKKSPEETGSEIGRFLVENCREVVDFNVIKGFLNISVSDEYWFSVFYEKISSPEHGVFGANGRKVMVEYSSPNTNKPLHLGHIRNNLLGYSVAGILKAYGYDVVKVNLVNDRGIHICKSMLAWLKFGKGETPDSSGLKGDHLAGKYYVLFDKEYKKQIEELRLSGKTEEEAKKAPQLSLKPKTCSSNGKQTILK